MQHEANGSSGSILILPIGLKALFITEWKGTKIFLLALVHIKTKIKSKELSVIFIKEKCDNILCWQELRKNRS